MECWKPIEGFVGYQVSDMGRIRSIERTITRRDGGTISYPSRVLEGRPDRGGYWGLSVGGLINQHPIKIHRLVAEAFVPNPQALEQVNHIDADKTNNRASNLEWVSRLDNVAHAKRLGLFGKKMTPEKARQAFLDYHQDGELMITLCERYDINIKTLSNLVNRRTWQEATEDLSHLAEKPLAYYDGSVDQVTVGDLTYLSDGAVLANGSPLLTTLNTSGHFKVSLPQGGSEYVHRLIAEAFVPNPHGFDTVHHINSDKTDNRASNLVWCRQSYNSLCADREGRIRRYKGSENKQSKLTDDIVREMKHLHANEGLSHRKLAKRFGIAQTTAYQVITRATWAHVQ